MPTCFCRPQAGLPEPAVDLVVDADLRTAGGALAHVISDLGRFPGRPTTPLSFTVAGALST
ncbi:hypothetical protein ACGFZU_36775 [Streptomyces tendae]|uniref:hypothetical protein n=1 Tax=Streptomyces tendae TaxID=1932 RepID=UPI00371A93F5